MREPRNPEIKAPPIVPPLQQPLLNNDTRTAARLNAQTTAGQQEALREVEGKLARAQEVLRECEEYFDNLADGESIGDPLETVTNKEARLLARVREVL